MQDKHVVIRYFSLLLLLSLSYQAKCQQPSKDTIVMNLYSIKDGQKEYNDKDSLLKFVNNHVQYPQKDKQEEIQGSVKIQFTLMKDGTISKLETRLSLTPTTTTEVVSALKLFPKYNAISKAKPSRRKYVIQVQFRLGPSDTKEHTIEY